MDAILIIAVIGAVAILATGFCPPRSGFPANIAPLTPPPVDESSKMSIHITHALRYGDLWFWSVTDDGASVGNGNCETMEGALTAIREAVLKYEAKANGN